MDSAAPIGHNNPPSDEKALLEKLAEDHRAILANAESISKAAEELPEIITNDDEGAKYTDYLAENKKANKALDSAREDKVAPYLMGQRVVNNFFKRRMDALSTIYKKADDKLKRYNADKADRERRERAEQAARDKAERDAAIETARLAEEALNKTKADAEAAVKAANEAAAAELAEKQKELDAATATNAADAETIAELKETVEELEEKVVIVKHESRRTVDTATRRQRINRNAALDTAIRVDQQAQKSDRDSKVKISELAQTRGDMGTSKVTEKYVGSIEDRMKLDLEPLREHFSFEDLQKALDRFVAAGGRTLKGAIIIEELVSQNR